MNAYWKCQYIFSAINTHKNTYTDTQGIHIFKLIWQVFIMRKLQVTVMMLVSYEWGFEPINISKKLITYNWPLSH